MYVCLNERVCSPEIGACISLSHSPLFEFFFVVVVSVIVCLFEAGSHHIALEILELRNLSDCIYSPSIVIQVCATTPCHLSPSV